MCNIINACGEAARQLAALEPEDVVMRSGAAYDEKRKTYRLKYFGAWYEIDCQGRVSLPGHGEEIPYNDRTLIMQYLCSASGLPPRNRWLSFLELPEGAHHHGPFHVDALNPLAAAFSSLPDQFLRAATTLDGEPLPMGDAAARFMAFPRLPLAAVLWVQDEEFPARANILFDAVSPTHLSTASLWVLGVELATKLRTCLNPAVTGAVNWLGKEQRKEG
ncbi:DUF3786 domain-containing protein [Desulfotomaculum copahuensis]|uniref:DUF3786 domain-containing protein n=1 Tax=Desulfotomaculum copahuensis TaxID=1838280 RepID=A0A1B7LC82_9FIRM|nr:DUF3786 domain-containing protein [Desulfotomaculum copahuensis]OAT80260.1 hypothetical protein A6M21_13985 [Desulfotomaculum copahuensis]